MTNRKRIVVGLAATIALAACSSHNESPQAPPPEPGVASARSGVPANAPASVSAAPERAVRAMVEQFGRRMQTISVLAPPEDVRGELPKTYGKLITPELMATWKAHPDQVAGREGSSPWPTGIVIHDVACDQAAKCRVNGKVDYITSNEVEHGGVFMRRAITLDLTHTEAGWRIAAVRLAPAAN